MPIADAIAAQAPCRVVAASAEPVVIARADAAASRLNVPRLPQHHVPDRHDDFILLVDERSMTLHSPDPSIRRGIAVDVASFVRQYRRSGLSRRQPLARAIGGKGCFVVDATAGLGQDAVMLAMLGHDVLAIERSPVLALMLEDAMETGVDEQEIRDAIGDRLRFQQGDARDLLLTLVSEASTRPDVVVIDPMFPPKRRSSALPRKQMQVLRQLVGDDPDVQELFAIAKQVATRRVVIKRSDDAPPLAPEPTATYPGKLVRYDVYGK